MPRQVGAPASSTTRWSSASRATNVPETVADELGHIEEWVGIDEGTAVAAGLGERGATRFSGSIDKVTVELK